MTPSSETYLLKELKKVIGLLEHEQREKGKNINNKGKVFIFLKLIVFLSQVRQRCIVPFPSRLSSF
ncbi:MAG TPA: hypothetical protein DD384_00640 [Firmicutes bacterium]|nr:hypothetical protein [Bacillota bacterium]